MTRFKKSKGIMDIFLYTMSFIEDTDCEPMGANKTTSPKVHKVKFIKYRTYLHDAEQ